MKTTDPGFNAAAQALADQGLAASAHLRAGDDDLLLIADACRRAYQRTPARQPVTPFAVLPIDTKLTWIAVAAAAQARAVGPQQPAAAALQALADRVDKSWHYICRYVSQAEVEAFMADMRAARLALAAGLTDNGKATS